MGAGDLIPVTDEDGLTQWVNEPPRQCPNGHSWAHRRGYAEGWFSCWCSGAQSDEPRPGHLEFRCKTCNETVLVPACTDPTKKTGWAAHHGG
jgi:hypothetical protein